MIIAFSTEGVGGVEVVTLVVSMTTLVTLDAMALFDQYRSLIEGLLERILADRRAFVAFLIALGLAPLGLIGIGWGLGEACRRTPPGPS